MRVNIPVDEVKVAYRLVHSNDELVESEDLFDIPDDAYVARIYSGNLNEIEKNYIDIIIGVPFSFETLSQMHKKDKQIQFLIMRFKKAHYNGVVLCNKITSTNAIGIYTDQFLICPNKSIFDNLIKTLQDAHIEALFGDNETVPDTYDILTKYAETTKKQKRL